MYSTLPSLLIQFAYHVSIFICYLLISILGSFPLINMRSDVVHPTKYTHPDVLKIETRHTIKNDIHRPRTVSLAMYGNHGDRITTNKIGFMTDIK